MAAQASNPLAIHPVRASTLRRAIRILCALLPAIWLPQYPAYGAGEQSTETIAEAKARMMAKKQMAMTKRAMPDASIHSIDACSPNGVALAGIDVVSYHKPTGPLIGSAEHTVTHNGLSYRFLSAAHAAEFQADPDRYLPQYFGWCATSLAIGTLTCPNPLNYKIENGVLLLFETTGFTNGQHVWNTDPLDYRRRANTNRDTFLKESASPAR